jgi:hypothetical protein
MRNTFSRTFLSENNQDKKFYFVPQKSGSVTNYNVHINRDPEVKKFKMKKDEANNWKIEAQEQKLPSWVFQLESQFSDELHQSIAGNS